MNIKVLSKYRSRVDEYEQVTVHANEGGVTACGRSILRFRVRETTTYPVDCKRCLAALDKKKNAKP